MSILTIESTINLNYLKGGSKPVLGILELEVIRVTQSGMGDTTAATFQYFGYDEGERFLIESDALNADTAEMNALYDAIRAGVPINGTKAEINLYVNSTTAIQAAVIKWTDLNAGLTINDFQIKP